MTVEELFEDLRRYLGTLEVEVSIMTREGGASFAALDGRVEEWPGTRPGKLMLMAKEID